MKKAICTKSKNALSKYLLGGMAVGALALSPFAAQAADDMMMSNDGMMSNKMVSSEPMLVTGTVENYWVDRAGFVSAMSVTTASGTQTIRFSPTKAQTLYNNFKVGDTINVWVTPHMMDGHAVAGVWEARGLGTEMPSVWMPVNMTSDFDWLAATPYVSAGATNMKYNGKLRGVVIDTRGEVLALALDSANGRTLVRVPAEMRQIARGHIGGSERVASLIKGSDVEVLGMMEATRLGHLSSYSQRVAANTIRINGKNAGAISIQMLPMHQRRALLGFDIGGIENRNMKDRNASNMGYMVYNASDMTMMPMNDGSMSMGMGTSNSMSTSTSVSQTATGRVMIVTADNQMLPVVKKNGKVWAMMADGSMSELKKVNGKFMVPADMTGSRMMMVMSDGSRMEMDTVNGQMMVKMADGSMAPVTLHTP